MIAGGNRANKSGAKAEEKAMKYLIKNGYRTDKNVHTGYKISGDKRYMDIVAQNCILIEIKNKESSGSIDNKLLVEICNLSWILSRNPNYVIAYIVLFGQKWEWRTIKSLQHYNDFKNPIFDADFIENFVKKRIAIITQSQFEKIFNGKNFKDEDYRLILPDNWNILIEEKLNSPFFDINEEGF